MKNTSNAVPPASPQAQLRVLDPDDATDLDRMESPIEIDYVSVGGFLRQLPNEKPWGVQNVAKFGAQVTKAADGYGVLFQSAVDPKLGPVRVFPAELVQKMYGQLAQSLGWPKVIDLREEPMLEARAKAKDTLGCNERAERALDALAERADNVEVLAAVEVIREFIHAETDRLRRELSTPTLTA